MHFFITHMHVARRYILPKILWYVVFSLTINVANAQPYYFKHFQVENGLSNNTVFFVRQDSKGFMWFATKDGLDRFDGFHFKVFRPDNAEQKKNLSTDYIFCILPGKDGVLWIGGQGGLYKYNPQKERLETVIDSLPNIYDITFDRHGQMWFISSNTLCRFDLKKSLKQFNPSTYFYASTICLSKKGDLWAGTTGGMLEKFDGESETFKSWDLFAHSKVPASRLIQKIHPGDGNSLFAGTTSQGLKQFNIDSFTYKDILTYNPDKTTIYIRDILQNTEQEYWFATESGIFIYHTDTGVFTNLKKKFDDPYSLNDNAIYALCKDAEGSIWAGTFFGGVNYYAKQNAAFRKYLPGNTENAISGNAVREICKDKYGNLWVGTEDGGLNEIKNNTNTLIHFKPTGDKTSIAYSNVHGLLAYGDDLWIGTFEHGIDVMDIRTGKIKKHFMAGPGERDLKSNFALCFLRTSYNEVLVGTSNGLYSYNYNLDNPIVSDPIVSGFERIAQTPGNCLITSLIEDHNKLIWAGTNNQGVFWFDPVTHHSGHLQSELHNKNSLSNDAVNDVYEDSNNSIWFSTEGGGLCKLSSDRKKFTRYSVKDGLPANFFFKVLEDNNKNLWASTSRGLVNFKPGFKNIAVYTRDNGLLNDQFNYHSGYKDEDGRLYFGSVKGMISFMPDDFLARNFVPPVYVTGFQVFNKELTVNDSSTLKKSIVYTDKITLPYYQSSVSIDFAALSYIAPEMTSYAYQLEGLDNSWTTITANRKVYFTNLSPDRYVFKLKANANGVWSNEKKLVIEILPPFWATGWAYLLYAILAILLCYYLFSNYHKRQQNKKEKEIYESKIEFFTNVVHEIKTPLTLIKGPVENLMEKQFDAPDIKEDIACLDRNTNRLMNLVSQLLDFRQTEIKGFSLYFTKINVSDILRETGLSFKILARKRNLDYNIIIPANDIYAYADGEALRKIFSNLISNAVKYADKKVAVRLCPLEKSTSTFTIEFENDGYLLSPEQEEIIFKPFQRLKETRNQKGTGIGLTLARSLAELQTGKLYMKFNKKTVNTFVLTLPLKHEHENRVSATMT
ncbi:MAG: ATP-binding protein [Bacteroidota bacterium]|nr:ATP-binding protein [Bacteroidota bacterium]